MAEKKATSKLVCNLGMADFFKMPGSDDAWRRKFGPSSKSVIKMGNKAVTGYMCENLYDNKQTAWLPGAQRVELVDV